MQIIQSLIKERYVKQFLINYNWYNSYRICCKIVVEGREHEQMDKRIIAKR